MSAKRMSRRDALRLFGIGAAGTAAALSGCAPQPAVPAGPTSTPLPEVTAAPSPTVVKALTFGKTAATIEEGQAAYGTYEAWKPSTPVNLTFWGPPGPDTDPWIKAMTDVVKRFMAKYPEITVQIEQVPWADWDTKITAALTAGSGPDMIFEADREAQYPRDKVVRPVPPEVITSEFIKAHKLYEVRPIADNQLYLTHLGIMGPILYANKALLAEKGVKPEDTPKTWAEFAEFAKQFTKYDGETMTQAGFAINGYARYIWNDMIYQQGAHAYDAKKCYFDSPESINAWQTIVDFYDKYKINDRAFLNFDEAFGKGLAAYAQVWTWFGSTLEGNYPDIDWAPVMYPTFTGKGPYGRFDYDGYGYMVTTFAQGDKEKAAWEFVKFAVHDYQYLVEKNHSIGTVLVAEPHPDYNKLFDEMAAKTSPSQSERRLQSLAVLSKQFEGGMVFPGEVAFPFDSIWTKIQDAILINKEPIVDVLKEYTKQYDELLAQTSFWITPEA